MHYSRIYSFFYELRYNKKARYYCPVQLVWSEADICQVCNCVSQVCVALLLPASSDPELVTAAPPPAPPPARPSTVARMMFNEFCETTGLHGWKYLTRVTAIDDIRAKCRLRSNQPNQVSLF